MKEAFVEHILCRLDTDAERIAADFARQDRSATRYSVIDELLPADLANRIADAFPSGKEMRYLDSFRERKYTSKALDRFDPIIASITFAFQDKAVVERVSRLCGLEDAVGDPHLYAGGISSMAQGHFLNPHIDNSHDGDGQNYRVLNLLYYVTPGWSADNGGSLELWDERVRTRTVIPSMFNRLVLMETNDRSWHSVNAVVCDSARNCISNYYFSPHSPNGYETTHVTYFMARPEQKVRRLVTFLDSELRSFARRFKRSGFARKDVYEGRAAETDPK